MDATANENFSVGKTTTFNGHSAIPIENTVTIHVPSQGITTSSGKTGFVASDGTRLGNKADGGVQCIAKDSKLPPKNVEVGDSGKISSGTCSDGSKFTKRYRIKAGDGVLVFALIQNITIDGSQKTGGVTYYRFAGDNNIVSARVKGSTQSNGGSITFDLSGPVTSLRLGSKSS